MTLADDGVNLPVTNARTALYAGRVQLNTSTVGYWGGRKASVCAIASALFLLTAQIGPQLAAAIPVDVAVNALMADGQVGGDLFRAVLYTQECFNAWPQYLRYAGSVTAIDASHVACGVRLKGSITTFTSVSQYLASDGRFVVFYDLPPIPVPV